MVSKSALLFSVSSVVAQLRFGSPVVVNFASQQPLGFPNGISSSSSSVSSFQTPSSTSSSSLPTFTSSSSLPTSSFGSSTFSFQSTPSSSSSSFSQTFPQSAQTPLQQSSVFSSFSFPQSTSTLSSNFPQAQPQQLQRLPSAPSGASLGGLSASTNPVESATNVPQSLSAGARQPVVSLQFTQSSTPISQQQFNYQLQQQQLFAQSFNQQPFQSTTQTSLHNQQMQSFSQVSPSQAQFVLPSQLSRLPQQLLSSPPVGMSIPQIPSLLQQQQVSAVSASSLQTANAQLQRLPSIQDRTLPLLVDQRQPTNLPSRVPSQAPSRVPSQAPSRVPSQAPSPAPSQAPSQPRPRAKAPSRQAERQARLAAPVLAVTQSSKGKKGKQILLQTEPPSEEPSPYEDEGLASDDDRLQQAEEENTGDENTDAEEEPSDYEEEPLSVILPTAFKNPSPSLDVVSLRAFAHEARTPKKSCVFNTCTNCSEAGCRWQDGMCKQECLDQNEPCYFLSGRQCATEPIIVSCIVNIPMNCRTGQQAPEMGRLPYPVATGAPGEMCVTVAKHYCIPRLVRADI